MTSPLTIIRIGPAYEQLAETRSTLIVDGGIALGQRLPAESELCQTFGVSRSTVRQALWVLSSLHLVVTTRGVQGGNFTAARRLAM